MPIPVLSQDDIAKLRIIFRWFFRTDNKATITPLGRFEPGEALGAHKRRRQAAGNGTLFPVYVTQSGGSAGNSTTQCTFTYNVFIDSAKTIQIGTTVALQKSRLVNCTMTAGTLGVAYYEAGTLKLWDVNERASQTNCT